MSCNAPGNFSEESLLQSLLEVFHSVTSSCVLSVYVHVHSITYFASPPLLTATCAQKEGIQPTSNYFWHHSPPAYITITTNQLTEQPTNQATKQQPAN